MARSVLAAAGMAALLAAACAPAALAANPTFSPNTSAGQQQAASEAAATAATADVWVASSVSVTSDSYMRLDPAGDGVPYFIQYASSTGYTLVGADGVALGEPHGYIDDIFTSEATGAPYFCVQEEEGLNKQALMDSSGQVVSDYAYDDFTSFGGRWVAAIALVNAQEGAEYDYTSSYGHLVIDHVDLYLDGSLSATLDRASYRSAVAVDDYLVVSSRDQGVCNVYGADGAVNQIPTSYWSADDEYYSADDGTLRFVNGAQVGTADCPLTYDDVTNPYLVGADGVSIYDIYGTQVAVMGFQVNELKPFVGDYAVVWGKDSAGELKYGVLDRDWNLVVPLEYDRIGADYSYAAFKQGYCYVEQGDKFGYLRADGSVAVPVEYSVSTQKFQGDLFCVVAGATGYQVVSAASGLLDAVYSDVYTACNGTYSPLLQAADANGLWGIVDWRGNTLVDFAFEYSFYTTPDEQGSLILVESGDNAYQILSVGNSISASYDDQVDDLMPAEGEMPAVADGEGEGTAPADAAAAGEASAPAEGEAAASDTSGPADAAAAGTAADAGEAAQGDSAGSAVSAAASLLGMAASALSGK